MTTTPQVPGCDFCNHPGFNTYEGDTCPECGRGTTPQVPGAEEEALTEQNIVPQAFDCFNAARSNLGDYGAFRLAVEGAISRWACRHRDAFPEPAAAPAAGEPVMLPAAVCAWFEAYRDYVQALEQYNARVMVARAAPFGSVDCNYEFQAYTKAHDKAHGLVHPMYEALAAATPSVPQTHPVHPALPSLGLHATEGRAETCDGPEGAPLPRSLLMTQAMRDVLAERRRQVNEEGWTPEHDDEHEEGELAYAAAGYAAAVSDHLQAVKHEFDGPGEPSIEDEVTQPPLNPWPHGWEFKPAPARRQLVKAGALIVAEIERLDRLDAAEPISQEPTGSGS